MPVMRKELRLVFSASHYYEAFDEKCELNTTPGMCSFLYASQESSGLCAVGIIPVSARKMLIVAERSQISCSNYDRLLMYFLGLT
jgi:hypothetical protein